jgi:hypothetical protein
METVFFKYRRRLLEMKWTILKEYRGIPVSVISSNRKTDLVQKAMKKAKMSSPSEEKMSQTPQEKTSLKLSLGGRRYAELTEWNGTKRVEHNSLWKPFFLNIVEGCLCPGKQ